MPALVADQFYAPVGYICRDRIQPWPRFDCAASGANPGELPRWAIAPDGSEIRAWVEMGPTTDLVAEILRPDRCLPRIRIVTTTGDVSDSVANYDVAALSDRFLIQWNHADGVTVADVSFDAEILNETILDEPAYWQSPIRILALPEERSLRLYEDPAVGDVLIRLWEGANELSAIHVPSHSLVDAASDGRSVAVAVSPPDGGAGFVRFLRIDGETIAATGAPDVVFRGYSFLQPQIVWDPTAGTAVVTWWENNGDPHVWIARVSPDGSVVTAPTDLGRGLVPSVGFSNGRFLVSYAALYGDEPPAEGAVFCGGELRGRLLSPTFEPLNDIPLGTSGVNTFASLYEVTTAGDDSGFRVTNPALIRRGDEFAYFCSAPTFTRVSLDGEIVTSELPGVGATLR